MPLLGRRNMPGPHTDRMQSQRGIRQHLLDGTAGQHGCDHLAPTLGDLRPVGCVRVALRDVCLFEAIDCSAWIRLGVTREAPAANGRADEVNGPGQARQHRVDNDPVELAQHEPLGATRGTCDRADGLGREPVATNLVQSNRAGLENEVFTRQLSTGSAKYRGRHCTIAGRMLRAGPSRAPICSLASHGGASCTD